MLDVTLDDKYTQAEGRVYVTGSQALARLPMMQRARDVAAGLNTAGYISGYRGSPLGIYDMALWQAQGHLDANHIHFQPNVNEDLAATSVWGSQQIGFLGKAKYDGVFSMWYGKGPGVDRSGDAIKHGNFAGAGENGGVLVLCGDDHAARSSSVAHQSDHALIHYGVPILNPSTVQEYLDLGLYGFALSRYSGCWVGFKCVTDTVESSASVAVDAERVNVQIPNDFDMPEGGLNLRLGVLPLNAEKMVFEQRHKAAQAFVRANKLDGVRFGVDGPAKLGIVTTGKAYLDVLEGLDRLGISEDVAKALGISVYKVAMTWPLEPVRISEFAANCEEVLVIEEKRGVIEEQLANVLYNQPDAQRPRLVGKHDQDGQALLSIVGELDPDRVLQVIADRYLKINDNATLRAKLDELSPAAELAATYGGGSGALMRLPSFCAGCPHNTSTCVPDGSTAIGGIGCHGMAVWLPDRNTLTLYHMGGEGAAWIGQAPFVEMDHIFQNLGDGTYFHSGLLAVRACVAANVKITYKVLLNGAISMTGGQPIEGEVFDGKITAPHVANQLHAEGVKRIAIVTDDVDKYKGVSGIPEIVTFHHRDKLDEVQKELRTFDGVSAIIYDQPCATERRRLRKRGKYADATQRIFINSDVCEGCGDCGVQSNCIALEPEETDLGRKRRINQSVCNSDYSCLKGMCPSFVTVEGGKLRAQQAEADVDAKALAAALPEPARPELTQPFSIMIAGIGGNGVVTIGALLGMAAHMEGKVCTVLDLSGLAQRNGAVTSHVRFAPQGSTDLAARIPQGSCDLVIGCDPVVSTGPDSLSKMTAERTAVVYNRFIAPTSTFASNPDLDFDIDGLAAALNANADAGRVFGVEATNIAIKLLGNAIGANLFMIGYAWQKGLVPLSRESLERAIELNGTAVALNQKAFELGRIAAAQPDALPQAVLQSAAGEAESFDALVERHARHLTAYQNAAYADHYRALVKRVGDAETALSGKAGALSEAVASSYAKLMAYKDEYEVARLYASPEFRQRLNETFEGGFKVRFNLAPPLLARRDKTTGRYRKMTFGPWMKNAFVVLSKLKGLRGTALDVFGYGAHRRTERALIGEYEALIDTVLAGLNADNLEAATELAATAQKVRGFDVVKDKAIAETKARQEELLKTFRGA